MKALELIQIMKTPRTEAVVRMAISISEKAKLKHACKGWVRRLVAVWSSPYAYARNCPRQLEIKRLRRVLHTIAASRPDQHMDIEKNPELTNWICDTCHKASVGAYPPTIEDRDYADQEQPLKPRTTNKKAASRSSAPCSPSVSEIEGHPKRPAKFA